MSNVKFNPTEGENDKLVSVFSEINEGLDTTLNYTISDEGNKAKKNIVVNQVGKREKFLSKKGEESEPFVLSDGNTFNVLKEGASGSASAWAEDQLPPEATESVGDKSLLPSWDFYLITKFYFKMRTYLWQRCYSPYYRCRDRKQMRIRF